MLSEANNTLASSSSTSYKTRGYLTHWKVYDATLKTNPFTYFHFSRDPFCLHRLIFSLLQGWFRLFSPVTSVVAFCLHCFFNLRDGRSQPPKRRPTNPDCVKNITFFFNGTNTELLQIFVNMIFLPQGSGTHDIWFSLQRRDCGQTKEGSRTL